MSVLTNSSTYDQDPYDAWQRVKHRRARPRALAVLRELAAWREKRASRTNVPRGRVVRDEALAEIASSIPRSKNELTRIRGLGTGAANGTIGDEILNAVTRGLDVPESEWPSPSRRIDLPEGSGELIALLQALLKLRCDEQGVAPRMVATREDLEKILADPEAPVRALSGWRRELFGEDALALLRGEIGLTGARGGLRLLRLSES
jgi:ribonuclease D